MIGDLKIDYLVITPKWQKSFPTALNPFIFSLGSLIIFGFEEETVKKCLIYIKSKSNTKIIRGGY